ncbi:hypothetical protein [Mesomycoplasma ovipneumoniae]|uniref:hypothetical protein n=1 Tax=Mesomycoplasma ovipneumoniae TaxID=29562 RepID=UPI0020CBDBCD|nr:hypothetical protein [Mesomycoplasma ovipneumoniae]MCP9306933.1 hypothetical protein [Mesomycoplasma ovipneumoniae]
MKNKLKFFKFITNIVAFSLLNLSVFGSLRHFRNRKSNLDFKVKVRDLDLLKSKNY